MGQAGTVTREQLELRIEEVARRVEHSLGKAADTPYTLAERPRAEPFGRWLLAQHDRGDWIDGLADAARRDTGFPKNGTPDEVRARMELHGADGDAFEQLGDAERCWASL